MQAIEHRQSRSAPSPSSPLACEQPPEPLVSSEFVAGPVDPAAASAAFSHHAEDAKLYSEAPATEPAEQAPNMSVAPPRNGYDDIHRPRSPKPQGPAVCDRDVSCAPVEKSLGEQLTIGVGKVWKAVGGKAERPEPSPTVVTGVRG